ncbi:MAG: MCE family protein [Deltaproteobacteria bacterium]|jgi:phospholipid/cholesterol/gamma-HCH transport system substrate-binding protein|nr:MCE family protein [Deltaproteobacteria bacterium]
MYSTSTEIKVGLFVLAALGVVVWMALRLGVFSGMGKDFYEIKAVFDEASGLKQGVGVEVAGINVGRVANISLYEADRALVILAIRNDVRLPADSRAVIRTQGVLGDKFIEIFPGTQGGAVLASGSSIEETVSAVDLSELLEKLGSVADDLKVLTSALAKDDGGQDLRDIVVNVKELSKSLKDLTAANGPQVTHAIETLSKVADNLENITDKVSKGQGTLGQLINDDSAMRELRATLAGLRKITDKVSSGEGTLGRLVNDETTIDKIDQALTSVNNYLEKSDTMSVTVDYRADWMTRYNYLKSTLGIQIHTSPYRYYLLGVTGDYFGRYSRTDYTSDGHRSRRENYERGRLKFNAQIAQRFYDMVLRGGVFESGAGVAVDYYLFDEAVALTMEAFSGDFDHNPHLRAMATWRFWKYFYLGAGYDDFISDLHRSSPFFSFGFSFTDDDLKELLGGASSFISK